MRFLEKLGLLIFILFVDILLAMAILSEINPESKPDNLAFYLIIGAIFVGYMLFMYAGKNEE